MPKGLCELKSLQWLHLSSNRIRELPADLGQLQSLQTIFANSNEIEAVPSSLADAKKLEKVSLANNKITQLPSELEKRWLVETGKEAVSPSIYVQLRVYMLCADAP